MGLMRTTTATMLFDGVGSRRSGGSGARGRACRSRWPGSTLGRLGIAAVATGVAQAAPDVVTVAAAKERESFGKPGHRAPGAGVPKLADMAAAVESARATYPVRRSGCGTPGARSPARRRLPR